MITVNRVPGLLSSGPVTATAGRDFVVIRPWDEVQGYLVRDGLPAQPLEGLLTSAQTVGTGPDSVHVWAATAPRTWSSGEKVRIRLVDAAGRATGSELPVPAGSSGFGGVSDGAGNLVIDGIGGTYLSRPAGLVKITAGDLLTVGPTRFLTVDCDDRGVCRTDVTDRRTGARRSLGVTDDQTPAGTGVISPDGRYASIVTQGGADGNRSVLVDLTTGRRRPIAVDVESYGPQSETWSPDGRWLFITDQKTLCAVDSASATVTAVTEVTTPLQLLAIRTAPAG